MDLGVISDLDFFADWIDCSCGHLPGSTLEYQMNDIESMLPSNEQIGHWEAEYFDEGQNFDMILIEAYKAGYQACEAKYEAAMAEIVNPLDLGIEFEDDEE